MFRMLLVLSMLSGGKAELEQVYPATDVYCDSGCQDPSIKDFDYFCVASNPAKFTQCAFGRRYEYICVGGLHWNVGMKECNNIASEPCVCGESTTPRPQSSPAVTYCDNGCQPVGETHGNRFCVPGHPSYFTTCNNGTRLLMTCEDELELYDPVFQDCMNRDWVMPCLSCDDRRPTTTSSTTTTTRSTTRSTTTTTTPSTTRSTTTTTTPSTTTSTTTTTTSPTTPSTTTTTAPSTTPSTATRTTSPTTLSTTPTTTSTERKANSTASTTTTASTPTTSTTTSAPALEFCDNNCQPVDETHGRRFCVLSNSRKYTSCENGTRTTYECALGELFDASIGACSAAADDYWTLPCTSCE